MAPAVVSRTVTTCSPSIALLLAPPTTAEARRRRRRPDLLSSPSAALNRDDFGGNASTSSSTPSSSSPSRSRSSSSSAPASPSAPRASKRPSTTEDRLRNFKDTCYGCGAPLQTLDPSSLGYVEREQAAAKAARRSKQRGMLLCARCRALSHGKLLPGVAEPWMAVPVPDPKQEEEEQEGEEEGQDRTTPPLRRLATPEELRAELRGIEDSASLVALVVDCLDVPGSLLSGKSLRSLVGRNPVFLVGTRADLLPGFGHGFEGGGGGGGNGKNNAAAPNNNKAIIRPQALSNWLADAALRRKLTVAGAAAVSSKTRAGVPFAASCLRRARAGRDVVVLGAANVGKSAFVRALVDEMRRATGPQFDAAAASVAKRLPVASAVPGTTLGKISLAAFASGGSLVDTPGLHLHHRVVHLLRPEEVGALQPRGPLRARRPPRPATTTATTTTEEKEKEKEDSSPPSIPDPPPRAATESATYLWGGLARFDLELPGSSSRKGNSFSSSSGGVDIQFVGPAALPIAALPLVGPETPVPAEVVDSACAAAAEAVRARGRGGGKRQQEEQEEQEQRRANNDDGDDGGSGGGDDDKPSSSSSPSIPPPAFGRESIDARGGLRVSRVIELRGTGLDVCVSGLPGWVAVRPSKKKTSFSKNSPPSLPPSLAGRLTVWAPRGVEVFVRPPLPVEEPMSRAMATKGDDSGDEFALEEDDGWWSRA